MRLSAVVLCAVVLAFSSRALAHGDLHGQILAVTAQLKKDPDNAELLHKRGELHRAHGEYRAALADYALAEKLNPKLMVVHLSRGRALLESERFAEAVASLTRFLKHAPGHLEALMLRARAYAQLRDFDAADADFRAAFAVMPDPTPDVFIERAANLEAAGRLESALAVLNEGLGKLPGVVTLDAAALELELKLKRHDAALARLDAQLAHAPRREALLARKASVLESAGKLAEAKTTREEALRAIESLPEAKRNLPSTRTLQQELTRALAHD